MGTVDAHLAAIADHVRYQQGYGDTYKPTTGRLVQAVRAALKPMARRTAGPKKELSWKQLDLLCTKLREKQNQPHRAASMRWLWGRDRFMFLLAMNGLLRASEVVRMAPTDLAVNTLNDGRTCLAIYVNPLCKNDMERKGHTRYAVERPGENTCVVAAWREYERSLQEQAFSPPKDGEVPLFPQRSGERITSDTPRGRLQHWIKALGIADWPAEGPCPYGFHSLRSGGATAAAQQGASVEQIRTHGNWRSDAVLAYIRQDMTERTAASAAMARTATPRL
jgi:integrase